MSASPGTVDVMLTMAIRSAYDLQHKKQNSALQLLPWCMMYKVDVAWCRDRYMGAFTSGRIHNQ